MRLSFPVFFLEFHGVLSSLCETASWIQVLCEIGTSQRMQSGICSLGWNWIRAQAEMQGEQTMITRMRDHYSKCFEMTNVSKPLLRFHLGAPLTRNRIFILLVHKKVAESGIDLKKEAEIMKDDFRMKQTETWSLGRNTKKIFCGQ